MLSCGQKRARINRDLAYLAAQYVTVIARASGASIIALEDLATLEARGLGKDVNNTVAQSARRVAANAIEHIATRDGLTVVDVPPRGTSANCPTCDNLVSRPGGYHSAACATCMFTVNRDDVGAVNTAKRALAAERVTRRRGSQRQRVTRQQHRPVIRCRGAYSQGSNSVDLRKPSPAILSRYRHGGVSRLKCNSPCRFVRCSQASNEDRRRAVAIQSYDRVGR
ncbi:zinc ribbon domain-containing protein [Pseudonocardia sp. ICBG601]|uniref:zinc ribbon domain-containing protein n=1 Tax=Pseudonocardia sp. ICBG601 TaxID=2846759 RepID=UPI001CF680BA